MRLRCFQIPWNKTRIINQIQKSFLSLDEIFHILIYYLGLTVFYAFVRCYNILLMYRKLYFGIFVCFCISLALSETILENANQDEVSILLLNQQGMKQRNGMGNIAGKKLSALRQELEKQFGKGFVFMRPIPMEAQANLMASDILAGNVIFLSQYEKKMQMQMMEVMPQMVPEIVPEMAPDMVPDRLPGIIPSIATPLAENTSQASNSSAMTNSGSSGNTTSSNFNSTAQTQTISNQNINIPIFGVGLPAGSMQIINGGGTSPQPSSEKMVKTIVSNQGVYKGEVVNGIRSGFGKFTFNQGGSYEGYWANNQANGKGNLTQANGDVYMGTYVNGKLTGQGTLKTKSYIYNGNFVDGNISGMGRTEWISGIQKGAIYTGNYVNGILSGSGKLVYPNGNVYEGQFSNNKRNGSGKLSNNGRLIYSGKWKDDKFHGIGVFYDQGGSRIEATFVNGEINGRAIIIKSDGSRTTQTYNMGKLV